MISAFTKKVLGTFRRWLLPLIGLGGAIAIYYYRWRAKKAEISAQREADDIANQKTQEILDADLKKQADADKDLASKDDALTRAMGRDPFKG